MSQLSHVQLPIYYVLTNEAWFVAQVRNWPKLPISTPNYVCKKVASRVSILGRVSSFVTKEAATLVHNALRFFHYSITVTLPGVTFYSNIQIDYSCDYSAYRIDLHGLSHVALAHQKQKSSCTGRLFPADALTTKPNSFFSVFTHQFLVIFEFIQYFTRFSNIHNYSTRQSMRLSLPNVKENFGKRTFLCTGAKIFNKLPLNIVKNENIQTFCRRARHFFLS